MVWAGVVLQCLHLQAEAAVHRSDVTLRSSVRSVQMRGRLREVTHPWPFLAGHDRTLCESSMFGF